MAARAAIPPIANPLDCSVRARLIVPATSWISAESARSDCDVTVAAPPMVAAAPAAPITAWYVASQVTPSVT
jgi:hypothetical protein